LHHGIGIGHETIKPIAGGAAQRVLPGGHNFGVLLPWWDMLMGSANFELRYDPTGVRDQIEPGPDGQLRDYGQGFCAQQWRGVLRLLGRA
ncbi:fatty acid hydroxylase, partial [Verminephrobacter sp. Larva24]